MSISKKTRTCAPARAPKTHGMTLRSDPKPQPIEVVANANVEIDELRAISAERDARIAFLEEENRRLSAEREVPFEHVPVEAEEAHVEAEEEFEGDERDNEYDADDVRIRYADKYRLWVAMQPLHYRSHEIRDDTELVRFWDWLVASCLAPTDLRLRIGIVSSWKTSWEAAERISRRLGGWTVMEVQSSWLNNHSLIYSRSILSRILKRGFVLGSPFRSFEENVDEMSSFESEIEGHQELKEEQVGAFDDHPNFLKTVWGLEPPHAAYHVEYRVTRKCKP